MTPINEHEELCKRYQIDDPFSPTAYEACDRIERLESYCTTRFIKDLDIERRGAHDFSLNKERWFTQEVETWAMANGLDLVQNLADQSIDRLDAIELLVSQVVKTAVAERTEVDGVPPTFEESLEAGDYNVENVIDAINSRKGDPDGGSFGTSLYVFVMRLIKAARARFDGDIGATLASRFARGGEIAWHQYRDVTYQIRRVPANEVDLSDVFMLEIADAPEDLLEHLRSRFHMVASAEETSAELRTLLDHYSGEEPSYVQQANGKFAW